MYLDHIQSSLLPLTPPRSTLDLSNLSQLPFLFGFFLVTCWIHFVLHTYSWVWSHPLECGQPTRYYILKENWLPDPRSHLLCIAPQLGIWAPEPLHHPCWNVDWLALLKDFCRQAQLPVWAHAQSWVLGYLEDTVSLWSSLINGFYDLSAPSSMYLSLGGEVIQR